MTKALVLSIVNQKGGVGKTTTAINLASFLSENGHKTLIVDMDSQSNATSGIGLNQSQIKANIYDLLLDSDTLEEALYPTPFDNLHIVPATRDLAGAEVEMVHLVSRETLLSRKIEILKTFYDFIIIDCPPSLGLLTLNALVASDKAVVPVQCDYFALEGVASLLNTIRLIQDNLNPNLEILGILLTMFDRRTAINKLVAENTRSYFKELVFDTIIPRNTRLTEAPSHGLPIALYNPTSKGSLAYFNLTKEVLARVK